MPKRTTTLAAQIARRLSEKREAQGLTLRELADRSGVSHSSIALIEANRGGRSGIDSVDALARALGVRPAWLAYGDGAP